VAVKLIRAAGALSATDRARFRFEAEAAASLDHPHIVKVYSFGERDGVPFLVMPVMTGGSLSDKLKTRGPARCFSPRVAAELVRDVALGVHHAHQRGLIHRDLKPGNILLDEADRPHVADFGLARSQDASVSLSGNIAGTPAYMSPEQARGEKGLTTAVDVWALGAILFELLTGRPPFGSDDVPSVMRRVIEEPAPSLRGLRHDIPRDLERICTTCLSKPTQDRYPSALVLAEELTRYLKGEPLSGDRRPRIWDTVTRALGWQREALSMRSWRVAFWGAASSAVAMATLQAAILLNAPLWVAQAAIAYYLIGWLGVMWWFLVAPRDTLNLVERASTAIHFGAKFGCLAILPVQLWLHDGNPVYALPSFLALVGLAVFAHGVTYWGRLYLNGLAFFAAAAAMPLVPVAYWPTFYGLLLVALQIQVGFHLRRVHNTARSL
jgi:eukaryotic-like serine/threonine-protein kinase